MKKRNFLLVIVVIAAALFAACTDSEGAARTFANIEENKDESKSDTDLYPAYVIEGHEKKWGYIDKEGKFVIEPQYDSAAEFKNSGIAEVSRKDIWQLIDKTGKVIMESPYLYSYDFSENKTVVSDGSGKSYLFDENGDILFQIQGSIDRLSEGMAVIRKDLENYRILCGYINDEGKVIIEPQYQWAEGFSEGRAFVGISEGRFGIIDKEGKVVKEIQGDRISGLSEDTCIFVKTSSDNMDKYGYMTTNGEVILDAVYTDAYEFKDGLAIVNAASDYDNKYGVINKAGEFVIPAEYSRITLLGNGIYAVPKGHDYYYITQFIKKALFDKTGKQLTEFSYYDLEALGNGMISATDDKYTYLIDEEGNEIKSFPRIEGIGSIRLCGKLYKAEADGRLYYYSQDGKMVWASDNTVRLDGGMEVKMNIFRPDRCMMIQYPEISGLTDSKVQDKINEILKDKFIGDYKVSNKEGEMYTDSIEIGYTADKNKDLLIISMNGYFYPIGAAHGMPYREDYHIDIRNGNLYTLEDLFKKDVKYKEKLTEIIKNSIGKINQELGGQMYSDDIGDLDENSGFAIKKDSLRIYFYPYVIAPYAAGFPEFHLDYEELKNLIDTEGGFWNSFDRDASAKSEDSWYIIYPEDKAKIEESIKNYENAIIEAINKNDFKLVEPWLYPDSSLYISQKKLVADLNQKNIKERLESYSIEDIKTDNFGVIRVYVTENIAIQYPGKDFEVKQFNWIYSVAYDYDSQQYKLTYIDNWEK